MARLLLNFFYCFILIFLAKSLYIWVFGPSYEYDTPRYVLGVRNVFFPPLYPLFLRVCTSIYREIYFVCYCQAFVFACICSLSIQLLSLSNRNKIFFSLCISLEPVSSFYVSNLMSEWLFLALLILIWSLWRSFILIKNWKSAVWLSLACLLLYLTRFVGEIFLYTAFVSACYFIPYKQALKLIFIGISSFYVLQIPLKYHYYQTFGYFQINAFGGYNLWNNASVLFPDSKLAQNPQSNLEKYLASRPKEEFSIEQALLTNIIWNDQFTAILYREQHQISAQAMNDSLYKIAIALILERPFTYVSRWVIPNIQKAFTTTEFFEMKETRPFIEQIFQYKVKTHVTYYKQSYWILCFTWLLGMIFAGIAKNIELSLVFIWIFLYAFALFFMTAVFQRYFYIMLPFLMITFIFYAFFNQKKDPVTSQQDQ